MKAIFIIITLSLFAAYSCMKGDFIKPGEKKTKLDTLILAGITDTIGVKYYNIIPDIKIELNNPWNDTDTVINIDINNDGTNDFSFSMSMCHPSGLGGGCMSVILTPIGKNEICIDTNNMWVDTIPYMDTISSNKNWSGKNSILYSYSWIMNQIPSPAKGYWTNNGIVSYYYIGTRIKRNEKYYYGWIKLSTNFIISEYAICEEYEY